MNKFFKIIVLTSILLFSSCVNDSNPEEFTVREYKRIRNEISDYFENEKFSCKNELNESDYEEWEDWYKNKSSDKYISPTVCRKKTEKKIEGNIYISEIVYMLPDYYSMVYSKEIAESEQLTLQVKSIIYPKEKLLKNETIVTFFQDAKSSSLNFRVYKYNGVTYDSDIGIYQYVVLTSQQEDDKNYKYYQDVFKTGITVEDLEERENPEEISEYFSLIVEKGYADNLLNEFKKNKEEADEIAKRFEKSEIYDKIYNLKY